MKRRVYILTAALLLLSCLSTWAGIGSWRSHLAYHNATQCVVAHDKVYVVSDGSLYSYSPKDEFVEYYDKSNILNDQGIRHIGICEKSNTLVVVYENGNIDLIRPNGDVVNISDIVNETTLDPQINDLRIINGKAYMSTNFGVVILDLEREEFSNTYTLGMITHSSVETNGFIYAATEKGLYRGSLQSNLLDFANWKLLKTDVYIQLAVFDQQLMGLKSKGAVYSINLEDGTPMVMCNGPIYFMHCTNDMLVAGSKKNVFVYSSPSTFRKHEFNEEVDYLIVDGDTYWTCNGEKGLNGFRYDDENNDLVGTVTEIIPNSPIRNHCQYLGFVTDERLLVAGGCLNWHGETSFDGTLMMYENGEWVSFEEEGIAEKTGVQYTNMTCIAQDPTDPNHHFASSFGQGIYEFRDMQFVAHYNHKNSPLESCSSNPDKLTSTRISRLQYDEQGNLWITNADGHYNIEHKNNRVDAPLKILKPDGSMISLYYKELENQTTTTDLLFDKKNGWVWVLGIQQPASVVCIDLNGTLEDTSDDRIKMFSEHLVDQDGSSVEVYYINDIVEDHNGDIWVMTDKGPYVLYETERVFEDNYHFTKIKIPRNDGTNNADYLLDGAYTTCVEIDAANRKWIGTLSNGLYLVGADGIENVHHFTKDNSPLPSNTIESLAMNHKTGELFIGTDKGLMSYVTNATRPEEEYDEEKVYAYPNPVTPDYNGLIAVVGLKANSHVKIINSAGRLVAEGTSLGGTFTWDGRTPQGQRVSTGVYYVLGSDEEGNEGIVTKVLFIK